MDGLDRAILRLLRDEGRLSNVELAQRVGLSPSPCLRRVRALEESGAIRGYHAEIDPAALDRFRVAVADAAAYEAFYMTQLAELPGLARVNSQFTMKAIKPGGRLPIG
jgi:Lrp/AsnC family leucine-responsive transcriptional regulator